MTTRLPTLCALLTLLALTLLALPATAFSPAEPGPTLGGAITVGQAHIQSGPRLDARLQGWLPAALLDAGPLRLGFEGHFALEGEESGGPCNFRPADDPSNAVPKFPEGTYIGAMNQCIESGLGARVLVGLEWGQDLVGRLEGGVGGVWRQARAVRGGREVDTRWSTSLVGRAVGLVTMGRALGGAWRVGLAVEASSLEVEAPAYAGGLVFEAVIVD